MKVNIDSQELQIALKKIGKVVPKTHSIPTLPFVMITTFKEKGFLQITGTNLDTSLGQAIKSTSDENGTFLVNHQLLSDFVSKGKTKEIEIQVMGPTKIKLKAGKAELGVETLSVEDYPALERMEPKYKGEMLSDDLKSLINKTLHAISNDGLRPVLQGIFMQVKENEITSVATDSHRLSKATAKIDSSDTFSFLIDGNAAKSILDFPDDFPVHIKASDTRVSFAVQGMVVVMRCIDGAYPDVNTILANHEENSRSTFKRQDLVGALERSLIVPDSNYNVTVKVTEKDYVISKKTQKENLVESGELAGQDGNDWIIHMNAKFLLDTIKAIPAEIHEVALSYNKEMAPLYVVSDPNATHLVLPIRLD